MGSTGADPDPAIGNLPGVGDTPRPGQPVGGRGSGGPMAEQGRAVRRWRPALLRHHCGRGWGPQGGLHRVLSCGQVGEHWGADVGQSGLPRSSFSLFEPLAACAVGPAGQRSMSLNKVFWGKAVADWWIAACFPQWEREELLKCVLPEPSSMEIPEAGLKGGSLPMWVMHRLWHLQQIAQNCCALRCIAKSITAGKFWRMEMLLRGNF